MLARLFLQYIKYSKFSLSLLLLLNASAIQIGIKNYHKWWAGTSSLYF